MADAPRAGDASTVSLRALVLLAATTALLMAWIVWRASLGIEIDRNEPWNAWHAKAVAQGQPLYPAADALVGNNYPPLSFLALGAAAALGADPLQAGRWLSLAALLAAAAAVAGCLRALGSERGAALAGALWYVAMMSRFQARYVGMDDPNLAALAVMALGMAAVLAAQRRGQVPYGGLALMVVAGFVKHNLVALPIVTLAWHARVQRRSLARVTLFCAALVAAGLGACTLAYGPAFWQQMAAPRQFVPARALGSLGWLLQNLAPALALWGLWASGSPRSDAARFSLLLLATTFGLNFLVKMGAGVDDNAYFEAALATAIAFGLAVAGAAQARMPRSLAPRRRHEIMIVIAVIALFASDHLEPMLFFDAAFRAEVRQRDGLVASEASRVQALPGAVACSVPTVCYRAGKSFVYDRYTVTQRLQSGRWNEQQRADAVRRGSIRFEDVDDRTRWRSDDWIPGGAGTALLHAGDPQ